MPPISKHGILQETNHIRKMLGLDKEKFFDVVSILEFLALHEILEYEICEDSEAMHKGEAFYDPAQKKIIIPDTVYNMACDGHGRARFTVTHELGHFFRKHTVVFGRNNDVEWKAYEDSEWQADVFASYLLAPPQLVAQYRNSNDVANTFGLSNQAAEIALNNAKKAGY